MNKTELKSFAARYSVLNNATSSAEVMIHLLALIYIKAEKVLNKLLYKYSLSTSQFNILIIVMRYGGKEGITQTEISKKMLVSQGNTTKLIDKLYTEKYITRTEDPHDRRHKRIKITAKGAALAGKLMPAYQQLIKKITKGLTSKAKDETAHNLIEWLYVLEGEVEHDENN